jgi:hypothetical protein
VDFSLVDPIARTVLYEGYLLYPYRTSSLKNRQPSTFGSLYASDYSLANGESEPWSMRIECLLRGDQRTRLQGKLRFLQWGEGPGDVLEREVPLPRSCLAEPPANWQQASFAFPCGSSRALQGCVHLALEVVGASVLKVSIQVENVTPVEPVDSYNIAEFALHSPQVLLGVCGGRFLSSIDPPDDLRALANTCRNRGAWPVLVGDRDRQDMILAAPIILYDFPQVAPESLHNMFDSTEIDELLTLRILTLTDSEKQAMQHDERARMLLERTQRLTGDQRLALHGSLRVPPTTRAPAGSPDLPHEADALMPGDHVRLQPRGRGDILDLVLEGKAATIASVEQDFEGRIYYSVTLDDDPGKDLGKEGKPGHRFYFRLEELKLLGGQTP